MKKTFKVRKQHKLPDGKILFISSCLGPRNERMCCHWKMACGSLWVVGTMDEGQTSPTLEQIRQSQMCFDDYEDAWDSFKTRIEESLED